MLSYIYFFYDQLVDRGGVLLNIIIGNNFNLPVELIIGSCGILILLEATRRAIGLPLVIIAVCFYCFLILEDTLQKLFHMVDFH
jgi:TRAP-type uncharacterized transport system fused permease subunit